ncbi:ANL family adenylate-forming protein [Helicobacter cholecystus]|uniref:ANL family adenylate-forming protein n=1 Tax=Helicobacter cholecystus TaxID=45498 RepID=UPI0027398960|nr:fatty acid--CoA ligase family protein [Helicobacter cholecystus]
MQGFLDNLKRFENDIAIISDNKSYTYKQLIADITQTSQTLEIPNQSIVSLIGDFNYKHIVLFFTLALKKCIIAPLPKNSPNNFKKQEIIGAEFYIQDSCIHPTSHKSSHHLIQHLRLNNQSGLIIFSSGSTGEPKAMLHNLDIIFHSHINKPQNKVNTISIFLFDHIAGIDVLLRQLSIGGVLTIPQVRTPQNVCQQITQHQVQVLPAPPTFLNLIVLSKSYLEYDLSSIQVVSYGSEPITPALISKLKSIFPQAKLKQSFGTSETNAIKIKTQNELFFKLSDPNIEYKIVDNELWIKSKTQVLGYLNASMESFVDGYFKTGDLVESKIIKGEEYIRIIGRAKELINVGGEKVLPQEVEGIITQIDGVLDCLVYGEKNAITGQSVSCEVVIDENKINSGDIKKIIRSFCRGKIENYKIPSKVTCKESLQSSERFKKRRL